MTKTNITQNNPFSDKSYPLSGNTNLSANTHLSAEQIYQVNQTYIITISIIFGKNYTKLKRIGK